ncbi:MAG: hypothetical protein R2780_00770 [Crocinitomicaceae bacterium]|nr:hypothetical protein [Crocinitomicaceae bacterium]
MSLKKEEIAGVFRAILNDQGIVEISWDDSLKMIEPEHLATLQEAIKKLGNGKRMPLYFTTNPFLGVSEEAQVYATTLEGTTYSLAIAVFMADLATKIDYNVFIKKNTPVVPTQAFNSKEEAFDWLVGFL